MSSRVLRPVRTTAVRFLVLSLVLTGTGPLSDLLSPPASDGYSASSSTQPDDVEVSMDMLDVPAADAAQPPAAPGDGGEQRAPGDPSEDAAPSSSPEVVGELVDASTRDFGMVGVTWVAGTAPDDLVVELRTRTDGSWTAWEAADVIELDDEGATRSGTDPVWVGESDGVQVRMLSSGPAPEDPQTVLIDGGTGLSQEGGLRLVSSETTASTPATTESLDVEAVEPPTEDTAVPASTGTGVAPQPTIVTRAEWGVDTRSESSCSTPLTSSVLKGIVLHHTAGANGYSREQAPGIVRGIHAYHTRSLGWCDTGYNFLVDAYGTIYEGRRGGIAKQVRGAHAGNWDANLYTTGISMIGNYDTVDVPKATRASVAKLMAWRLSSFGLGAFGKFTIGGVELPRISGHRDIYSRGVRPATATACPGRYGYGWLNGGARKRVQNLIDAAKTAEPEPEPAPEPEPEPAPEPEPEPVASDLESYWVPADRELVVRGRGYGHGRGLSQYGAQGAAEQGLTYDEITDFYYPGTEPKTIRGGIRVLISDDVTDDVIVDAAKGLRIRSLADRSVRELPVRTRIKRWRLVPRRNGRTVVQFDNGRWKRWEAPWAMNLTGDAEFLADVPMTLTTAAGRRTYRGRLQSISPKPGVVARDTVNLVTVDQYVKGVLAEEMPATWLPEALKAQAVAARTYAVWSRDRYRSRYYHVCDTVDCQVYGGVAAEHRRTNRAVRQTSRQILTYQGEPALTQFSASSGGWTTAGGQPYLRAQEDPYDGWSGNKVHRWSATVDAAAIQDAYPAIGRLHSIEVSSRDGNGQWEGRVTRLVLLGSDGRVDVSADDFRMALGLRSTWFRVVPTPIIRRWHRLGGPSSVVGSPRNTEFRVASGTKQRFDDGAIFHSRSTGPRELYGPLLRAYGRAGGPKGSLGFPTTAVRPLGRNWYAKFQGGGIYKLRGSAPVTVEGRIHVRYVRAGGVKNLGWPHTSNYDVPGGERVDFGKASIVWNRSTGRTRIIWN